MKKNLLLRRQFILSTTAPLLWVHQPVSARSISQISQSEAARGLKSLLDQAANIAIKELGVTGGFSNNKLVRIALPEQLESVSSLLRRIGMSKQLDRLEKSMNESAEQAVAVAQPILKKAITDMTFQDAKSIITEGDTAGTAYLERSSRTSLFDHFRPIVKDITGKTTISAQYNALLARVPAFGNRNKDLSIETYVTNKALNGLFVVMGEKETYIRNHPAEAAASVAQKVLDVLLK